MPGAHGGKHAHPRLPGWVPPASQGRAAIPNQGSAARLDHGAGQPALEGIVRLSCLPAKRHPAPPLDATHQQQHSRGGGTHHSHASCNPAGGRGVGVGQGGGGSSELRGNRLSSEQRKGIATLLDNDLSGHRPSTSEGNSTHSKPVWLPHLTRTRSWPPLL